jgi:serine/threonine protein kinase
LIDRDLNVKIGDFGFTRENAAGIITNSGSEFHRAPEIVRHIYPYDGEKADIFALSIVLFAIQMK